MQFELWMYFQCLLNPIYKMTWKFNLHHNIHMVKFNTWKYHYNIYTLINFRIFEIIFNLI